MDSTNLLNQIAVNQAEKEVTANENFAAASPAMLYARNAVTSAGLTWGYTGGRLFGIAVASGTVTLTASATNYVVALKTTGVVSTATTTTNWANTAYVQLYSIVTGATTATSYVDYRTAIGADQPTPVTVNLQTGTTYTYLTADKSALVSHSNAAAIAGTLPQAGAAFPSGWFVYVQNVGVGTLTITPTTSTVDGAATLALTTGQGVIIVSNGTHYYTMRGIGGGSVSTPSITVNLQTGTSYAYLSGDAGKLVSHSNAAAIAGTIAQAGTGGFIAGWYVYIQNTGAGTLTITPTTSTVDGAASIAIPTAQGVLLASNGTNYYTMRGTDASSGSVGSLTNFTGSLNTASPNNTTNAARLLVTGGTTDVDFVVSPKGLGALQAQLADGTLTGGNRRGAQAVDFQMVRASAAQVASGQYAALTGGNANTASGSNAGCFAGNSNSASSSDTACVGGNSLNASANYASAIGGSSNTASAQSTFIGGGQSNVASAQYAAVMGGTNNTASGVRSIAGGFSSSARSIDSTWNWAGSSRAAAGDRGIALIPQSTAVTTNATPVVLTTDGTAESTANTLVLPNNSTVKITGSFVARNTTNNDSASWAVTALVSRDATAATVALIGTPTVTQDFADAAMSACVIAIGVNTTNGSLKSTATGIAATNIAWSGVFSFAVINA